MIDLKNLSNMSERQIVGALAIVALIFVTIGFTVGAVFTLAAGCI